jgi:hypothetical protein
MFANSKSSKTAGPEEANKGSQQAKNDKQPEASKVLAAEVNLWTKSIVNPQDLMHNFQHLETGAGGAISHMSVYRSITPNDTPESSKDGISEPNSDFSEGLDLNINLDWQPFRPSEGEDLMDFCKINVNPDEEMGGMFGDENSQLVLWNDFMDQSAFDKPFVFDASLFSMTDDFEETAGLGFHVAPLLPLAALSKDQKDRKQKLSQEQKQQAEDTHSAFTELQCGAAILPSKEQKTLSKEDISVFKVKFSISILLFFYDD